MKDGYQPAVPLSPEGGHRNEAALVMRAARSHLGLWLPAILLIPISLRGQADTHSHPSPQASAPPILDKAAGPAQKAARKKEEALCSKDSQKTPCLNQPSEGDRTVTGKGAPGSEVTLKVDDVPVKTRQSIKVKEDGTFKIPVDPALGTRDRVEVSQASAFLPVTSMDAFLTWDMFHGLLIKRLRPFAEMTVDKSLGHGESSVQTFIGRDFDLTNLIWGSLAGVTAGPV